ncbi:MAG: pimelyl-ACP methyl ester esterase BioV [Sulfurimonadaceae bacterium]|jgi:surfactin synthase thioesterase subunit|nr:pimelyl-ACP methyl ester esterase BioV [Sulfurimonadaceae bacterium]
MKFFSGFSLQNDREFFNSFIKETEYTVAGFSYGAILAFAHAKKMVEQGKRVDTLQLFSPAFFETKSEPFKQLQLRGYKKNPQAYINNFLTACFAPHAIKEVSIKESSANELEELLFYKWNLDALVELKDKGVVIEVYLGSEDKIIDAQGANALFIEVATVTTIKGANHFLEKGECDE